MASEFQREISSVINRHSCEQQSNTPDFILARYLADCLDAFDRATIWCSKWHSAEGVPEAERENGPQIDSAAK